jgi:aromatic-L-amino-acid decarboxylase
MIQKDIDLTRYLTEKIRAADDFEVEATADLAVVCFRYVSDCQTEEEKHQLTARLIPALESDGRVFITGTRLRGKLVLRACLINHRKTKASTDYLLDVIRDVGRAIA